MFFNSVHHLCNRTDTHNLITASHCYQCTPAGTQPAGKNSNPTPLPPSSSSMCICSLTSPHMLRQNDVVGSGRHCNPPDLSGFTRKSISGCEREGILIYRVSMSRCVRESEEVNRSLTALVHISIGQSVHQKVKRSDI